MRIRTVTAIVLSAAILSLGLHAFADAAPQAKLGAKAPVFTLKDQTGKPVSLSDFAGKIVVLEWFNDGCPFVQKHYKSGSMNSTAARYGDKDVVWLAINSTDSASVETNAKVAQEWKIDRPILDDSAGTVGHLYGATNTPHMFIVDKDGKLVYSGAIDSDSSRKLSADATNYVANALDELLQGKPISQNETKPYGCTVKYKEE
jgi:peroxiredoxin